MDFVVKVSKERDKLYRLYGLRIKTPIDDYNTMAKFVSIKWDRKKN